MMPVARQASKAGAASDVRRLERAVRRQEHCRGPDHRDALAARIDLALAYLDAGRADEARQTLETVASHDERVPLPDVKLIAAARLNLGSTYLRMQRPGDATREYEQAVWLSESSWGRPTRQLRAPAPT